MHQLRFGCVLSAIALAALATGCAAPKTADEFRKMTRSGTPLTTVNTFEVDRTFREVSDTLRDRAQKCLNVRVDSKCLNCLFGNVTSDHYYPTLVLNRDRAELHLQVDRGRVIEAGAPPKGNYRVVLDAVPAGPKRTRIETFSQSWDDRFIRVAFENWARGENLGCPDLTKR